MEAGLHVDLTYVTERIITVCSPAGSEEETQLQSLRKLLLLLHSKHGQQCMLINLSEKNDALTRSGHRVVEAGWLELLSPSMDQLLCVCSAMDSWLHTHLKNVLVLHCRGRKGRLGVLLASYIHYSNVSASDDVSLDLFAMRRFYSDQLAALMTPSQKRYVWMLGSMLRGGLMLSPSPTFLLCVVLHGLPRTRADGESRLFLRIYQSLQPVCTSAVYRVGAGAPRRLFMVLQPAQLLKGDIMVVCYDKNVWTSSRQLVFRLQFHTGLVHGHAHSFSKAELDWPHPEPQFPDDGKVELILSDSPEKISGRELWINTPSVTVDYDTLDPLVRRDSYQDTTSSSGESARTLQDPGDGGPPSRVKQQRRSAEDGAAFQPSSERAPSASSDSGLSVGSQGGTARGAAQDRGARAGRPLPGLHFEVDQSLLEVMTELASRGIEGGVATEERETDILEDEDEAAPASEPPSCSSVGSLSSETLPGAPGSAHSDYSTRSWVQQQQLDGRADGFLAVNGGRRSEGARKARPPPLLPPDTAAQERSGGGAGGRGLVDRDAKPTNASSVQEEEKEEELALLTTDIDESIEQLNQLILDLDPTFVPVPTRCAPLSRSASLHSNGLSHRGAAHLSGWRQQKQMSDMTDYAERRGAEPQCYSPSHSSPQRGHLHQTLSMDHQGHKDGADMAPPTPTFPVSPPTPYVKHFWEASQLRTGGQWQQHGWEQDSRGFLDSVNHGGGGGGGSAEGELRERMFGSMCSVSSGSPLPHTDSSTPPPVWHDRIPNSQNSPLPQQASPTLSLSTPNAHSSPRGGRSGGAGVPREADSADLSSLMLGNGSLEHSLLEAMEGLGGLGVSGGGLSLPPLLPEKRRAGEGGGLASRSPSLSGFSSPHSGSSLSIPFSLAVTPDPLRGAGGAPSPGAEFGGKQDTVKFVQDTSKFWYKPDISRDQAITVLKDKEPGSFIVRDSHSFRGAYGLAMKVATPPPSVLQQSKKVDMSNELVRHFLIECTQKGVRLKGCPNEPYFGSLTALVCQHSITPLALPCKLILPDRDPVEELNDTAAAQTATNSAAELLKQGAACNVWYLGSVELESLTGHQAVQKATTLTLAAEPPPPSTVVHFKVSAQGITLTDNQRKLFFRRHYAVNTVIFCSLDPQGRKWTRGSGSTAKVFGFVARKSQSETENMCHLFAEHDPEQPASAIVNFVSKVMIGSHKK